MFETLKLWIFETKKQKTINRKNKNKKPRRQETSKVFNFQLRESPQPLNISTAPAPPLHQPPLRTATVCAVPGVRPGMALS